jgi:hypothetical protein
MPHHEPPTSLSSPRQIRNRVAKEQRARLLGDIQRCFFCGEPVSCRDGHLEFYADHGSGRLTYPENSGRAVPLAVFTHSRCGPDSGYSLQLKRCTGVSERHGWIDHIRTKVWFSCRYALALVQAEAHVKAEAELAREKRKEARAGHAARAAHVDGT